MKTTSNFIIHIASYSAPASGKNFNLFDEEEKNEAIEYTKQYDEPCIQVVDNDGYDIPSEISLDEYISFVDIVDSLDEYEQKKLKAFLQNESFRYINSFDTDNIDLYDGNLNDLAYTFVDDWLYGEIPESIKNHIDYSSMAHDLSFDYTEMTIDGEDYCVRFN